MANGADGSIVIDTALDTTGFEAGSKRLEQEVNALKPVLEHIGATMQKGVSTAMPSLVKEMEQVTRAQESVANAGAREAVVVQQEMARAVESSSDLAKELEQVKSAQESITGTRVQGAGITQQQLTSAVDSASVFAKEMHTLERSAVSLSGRVSKMGESVQAGFSTDRQLARFQAQVDITREKVAQLTQQLAEMGGQSVQTVEYTQLSGAQQKAEQALLKLYNRREMQEDSGVEETSQAWKRLTIQIQNAEAEVQRYEAAMAAMQANGTAFVQGGSTAEYQQTAAALQDMSARLAEYESLAGNFDTISAPAQASRAALASVDAELQQKPLDADDASSALAHFGDVLRNMGSAALTATRNLAASSFRAFTAGIRGAISASRSLVAQSHKATLSSRGLVKALTSIKTILISRVKERFISAVTNGIRESMQTLAQFDADFNTSMSNIKNAAKGLSANLSVSLGGLINAIEPVVTRIINAISRAISYLNALFAMLGGKSTVTVAKKQMDSYADSAAGAGGAVKELKRQVYGFDELNKRSKDSDGGGGGGMNPGDLFEEVPIESLLPDSLLDMYERIKAAFEAGDWRGIGTIIAEGLNSGMAAVDNWITGTLQPMAVTWTGRIAEILNGIVGGLDWNLLGKLVSDGLNTVLMVANTFLTTFDFKQLGIGLGNGITSVINNLKWDQLGALFANKWNAVIHFAEGVVQAVDWSGVGAAVSNLINSMVSTIDWSSAGQLLSDGVEGLLTGATTAIQGIDWQQVGEKTAELIENIDWSGIGKAFLEGIGAAIKAIGDFIVGLFAEPIAEIGEDMDPELKAAGADIVGGIIVGIGQAILNIGMWIWDNVCVPIIDAVKEGFGIHSPSTVMQEFGVNIVEGLLNGIKETWSNITSFFSSALDGLKTGLQNAWGNIKTGASTAWNNIKTAVTKPFSDMKNAVANTDLTSLKTSLSNGWNNIKSSASTSWNNIKTAATKPFSALRTTIGNTDLTSLKTSLSNGWQSIQTTAGSAWSGISSSVSSKWNSLKSTMQNTNWSSVGSNICSGIASGINAGWEWLTSTVSNLASGLLNAAKRALGIHSPSRLFRDEVGENIGLGIAEGVTDTKANVLKAVSSVAQSATDGIEGSKIKLGVDSGISGLGVVADKLADIAASFHSIISMLTSLGGLSIPQIAAGSVVPVKTRVSGPDGYADYPGVKETDFDDYMRRIYGVLRDILDECKRTKQGIDLDTLTRAIMRKQKELSRSYGV